jgi:hypothetical protein
VTRAWFKLYRADRNDESSWKIPIASIEKALRVFEEELDNRKSSYFGGEFIITIYSGNFFSITGWLVIGDTPGMLDYMIWPWFERMEMLPILSQGVISISFNKFPKLVREKFIFYKNHNLLTISN